MTEKHDLVLGDKTFKIDSPLTFKQLRIVEPAILRIIELRRAGATEEAYDKMADVILACVMKSNPEFTRAALDDTPVTPEQVTAAFHTVGLASGLLKPAPEGENKLGEDTAESLNP